jgi:prolyl oligopeptidase
MSQLPNACLIAGLALAGCSPSPAPLAEDPHVWLEDVEGEQALDWVRARNARAEAELAANDDFKRMEADILAVLDSDAKIPGVEKIGAYYYNFWKDKNHERGIWRRTTLQEYRKAQPKWETALDLDALNVEEGTKWVWHGADCLKPDYRRCLIALSPGGSDADVTREFDLVSKTWVKDGFFRPEAKGALGWINADSVYVYTDFGPGTLTSSGYPNIVKEWQRGTDLAAAKTVYEGQPGDLYIAAARDHTPGYQRDFVSRSITFYTDEMYLRQPDGSLARIDAPDSAQKSVHKDWLVLQLRESYEVAGRTWQSGSLIAARLEDFMAGKREFVALFEPTDNTSLAGHTWTRDHLVLNVMEDVKYRLSVLTPGAGAWTRSIFNGAPIFGTIDVQAVDPDESNAVWLVSADFLSPTTLSLADIGSKPEVLKSNPSFFDGSSHVIEQHFATSTDGTRVPYFLVRPKDLALDGTAPTLLYGYGGFEVSMTPTYSGGIGKSWLEKGGVYVLANIRGGGEYGPRWHQAALKQNRYKAFEDFAAVADDLVARKITSPAYLGTMGGSNGGLLMGNMLMRYPEKFAAVVVQVPLLDMQRYSKLLAGASWMAEYGDPRAVIRTSSVNRRKSDDDVAGDA